MADTLKDIENTIERGESNAVLPAPDEKKRAREPSYMVMENSRIPVAKATGKLWQSRKEQALARRKKNDVDKAWDEALRYYHNDQLSHRHDAHEDAEYAGNESAALKMHRRFSETENIVFANTSALVPTLYAKNPTAEFTHNDPEDSSMATLLENLVGRIMSRKAAPGINLKPKVRKSVVMCTLTNAAYIEVGYTFREQSSEKVMDDIAKLSEKLEKAKTAQEVEAIEGQIMALEMHIDVLRPSGPFAKFRRPQDVIWDIDSVDDDHSDANWCMIADYVSTAYLNARYTMMKGKKRVSVFKPTHVIKRSSDAGSGHGDDIQREIDNFSLFRDEDKMNAAQSYGYNDESTFNRAQRTKVWYVWDRTTRRCLMYADNDWTWPIWVWDDPYNLQGFFPIFKLQFLTDPEHTEGKGEVTYYLDQQDALNTINSEMKQARQWARRNVFFDKNRVSHAEVEKMIKGDEDVAVGVDLPEGMSLNDLVQSVVPPSMKYNELFNKEPILQAIDRVSSVMPVMRGVEFKTNTTNQAINQYNSIAQTRADEKIDAVEDFIGSIAWAVAQMCLQFMSKDEVAMLIGDAAAAEWRNMSAEEINRNIQMTVVGGSTQKPTAEAKKQQALQMGQVLGQFVNAAPMPIMVVLLDTLRAAFNDTIPDEKWQLILDQLMQGGGGQSPQSAGGDGRASPERAGAAGGGAPVQQGADPIAALEQVVDALPPEAKQALGMAMARGVPVREALERIIPAVQQQQTA